MSSKNESICRVCLKIAKNEFVKIDGLVEQILSVLLLKLDLDITRGPIICEECMEVAKKCLDFKSTCISTEKNIVLSSVDRKKIRHNIRDIYEEKEQVLTVINEQLYICRFCLTCLERSNFVSLDSLMNETIVDMLLDYIPETDLDVIENPIICRICRENLDSYVMFVTNCLGTEDKIKAYCKEEGINSKGEVTLGNIPHFLFGHILQNPEENYGTYKIKEEPETFEDADLVHHKPHSELMILEEELDIKEERINFTENMSQIILDKYGDMFRSNQDDKYTKPDIIYLETSEDKTEERTHQKKAQVKAEIISSRAAFKVNRSDEKHEHVSKKKTQNHSLSSDGAIQESNTKKLMLVHNDVSEVKMFKCSSCTYEAKQKGSLKAHTLVHKDVSKIKMHKCLLCTYEAKRKGALKAHMIVHKDVSEVKTFKCSMCSFETKRRGSLKTHHMLIHADISEKEMYKCSLCTFSTKRKSYLKNHMIIHTDISEIKMYKCSLCTYEAKRKDNIKSHVKKHMSIQKDISEIKMYKCSLCSFQTKHKSSLKNHKLIHTDISEIKTYKCYLCTYKSKTKGGLKRHESVHKNSSEINMYKCLLCSYETKDKCNLKRHMLIHSDISEIEMYKCSLCAYKSKRKSNLEQHMAVHDDILEIQMYKCSLCALETKRKSDLIRHMMVHRDASQVKS